MSVFPANEFVFRTPCGHHGTIKPVKARGGPCEGRWQCRVSGPRITGVSGGKTVYANPDKCSAQLAIARYLRLGNLYEVQCMTRSRPSAAVPPSSPPAAARIKQESASIVTPSPTRVSSASLTSRSYGKDKWEAAPNGMAKCKNCQHKIQKRDSRIGKWTYFQQYEKFQYAYYHQGCVSEAFKAGLQLPDPQIQANRQGLLAQRGQLRQRLRQLRLAFAKRLDLPAYCIFNDATLDDITVRLPQNKAELCGCLGIKEKKFQNFGSSILAITKQNPSRSQISGNDDDDDIIVPGETLSCEAIVDQKFQHARENGYVIAIV